MGNLSVFLKPNKLVRKNEFYPATKSIVDEEGNPVEWEIRPVETAESERIRRSCYHSVPIPGKRNRTEDKFDANEYLLKMVTSAIVYPDLNDAELQDSYGVRTPEDLLMQLIDNPSEYADLQNFVTELSGFDREIADDVEDAKN